MADIQLYQGESAPNDTRLRTVPPVNQYLLACAVAVFVVTGVSAVPRAGHVLSAASRAFAETGSAAAARTTKRLPATVRAFTETGSSAAVRATRKMTAAVRAYVDTGSAASPKAGRRTTAAVRSYALTGTSASVRATRTVTATTRAYALTGTAAQPRTTRKIAASTRAFVDTGSAAGVRTGHALAGSVAAFTETGRVAAVRKTSRTPAVVAAFAETGAVAALVEGRRLPAVVGAFHQTGRSASLIYTVPSRDVLTADTGLFELTAATAGVRATHRLAATTATYGLTGVAVASHVGRSTASAAGVFVLGGTSADLTYTPTGDRVLAATSAGYTLSGAAAILSTRSNQRASDGGVGRFVPNLPPLRRILPRVLVARARVGAFALTGSPADLSRSHRLVTVSQHARWSGAPSALRRATRLQTRTAALTATVAGTARTHRRIAGQGRALVLSAAGGRGTHEELPMLPPVSVDTIDHDWQAYQHQVAAREADDEAALLLLGAWQ